MFGYLFIAFVLCIIIYFIVSSRSLKRRCDENGIVYIGNGTLVMLFGLLQGNGMDEFMQIQYKKMKSLGCKIGLYSHFGTNVLQVHDPEILKQILVKDFEHFTDHRQFIGSSEKDYLLRRMLFPTNGNTWKRLRVKLSPTFTTGKIKRLFTRFNMSGEKFIQFLNDEMENSPNAEVHFTTAYAKFTMDVISSVVCGIDANVFNHKDLSLFEKMGQTLNPRFNGIGILKIICISLLPEIVTKLLGISLMNSEAQDFFSTAIKHSIADRQTKGVRYDDFLQLMLEAREGKLNQDETELELFEKEAQLNDSSEVSTSEIIDEILDEKTIIANCFQFISAGLEAVQSILLFVTYELALNQNIQNKLRNDINKAIDSNIGKLTYEVIGQIVYLDMIINECLRRWSPAIGTDRLCVKDYKVPGTDFVLKKGEAIGVPIGGFHMDSDIFPNPEKFDPERFSPKNKQNINQYEYMPFGQGPRNCIGMRFAIIEAKVAISKLVQNFTIQPSRGTMIPMKTMCESARKPKYDVFLSLHKIQH